MIAKLLIISFLVLNINNVFAKDIPMASKVAQPLTYTKEYYLKKGLMNCETDRKGTKENSFIEQTYCAADNGSVMCLIYKDRSSKGMKKEIYCYNKLDALNFISESKKIPLK